MSVRLIKNKEELQANIESFHSLEKRKREGDKFTELEERRYKIYKNGVRKGVHFVACEENGFISFTPSKFAGYYRNENPNTIQEHWQRSSTGQLQINGETGLHTTPQISDILGVKSPVEDENLKKEYEKFCDALNITPIKKNEKKFWKINKINLNVFAEEVKENAAVSTVFVPDGDQKPRQTSASFSH